MGVINISSLKPGMVLSEDVKDRNGRLLLTKGHEINDKSLRILKIWGVTEAPVEGVSKENIEEEMISGVDPMIMEAAEAYTRSRFIHCDMENEIVEELFRLCSLRKAQHMARLGVHPDKVRPLAPEPEPEETPEPPELVDIEDISWESLKLGSLPIIFHKLVEVVNDPRSSASDVAEVIGNDPDLSMRLLKVVNSSFYGLSSKVDTITRAVAIIGSNQLVSLAMGMSVITYFKGISEEAVDMDAFWRHSISCGLAARLLASHMKNPNSERFFVAGLLHDVGRLVIFVALPEHANMALAKSRQEMQLLVDAEREILGFTHQELGAKLMHSWKLPLSLENNVRHHHDPMNAPMRQETAVITLADAISNGLENGTSGERLVPRMNPLAMEELDLPLSVISQATSQLEYQVEEILGFFNTDD